MAREVSFMFKDLDDFVKLKGGVLSYLQRDIDKLIKMKDLDAEFVNIATPGKSYGMTWLLFKVYYTWFEDADDMLGNYAHVYFAYPIQQNLFTRDHDLMTILDGQAKIQGRQDKLSDIDLVKVRILYHIFHIINSIQNDSLPIKLPTKKYIVVDYADAGNLFYELKDRLPGGFN